jgi:hypothetical protein
VNAYHRYTVAFLAPEQVNGQPLLFQNRLLGSLQLEMTDSQIIAASWSRPSPTCCAIAARPAPHTPGCSKAI